MPTQKEIIAAAEKTLGTPWFHLGRSVPHGLDCIGMILWVSRHVNFSHYEPPEYPRDAIYYQFEKEFDRFLIRVDKRDYKPGDVVVFRQDIFPCHCGIISWPRATGEDRFIHAFAKRKKVVEEVYTNSWKKLTRAVFRFPEVKV